MASKARSKPLRTFFVNAEWVVVARDVRDVGRVLRRDKVYPTGTVVDVRKASEDELLDLDVDFDPPRTSSVKVVSARDLPALGRGRYRLRQAQPAAAAE